MNNDISASLLKYYFDFQEKFKPVKDYKNPKDIVVEALKTLAKIIKDNHKKDPFLNDIKLVYLNYFMENTEGQFDPIFDELIYISENEISNGDMKNRILQHMSFYIANNAKEFIRISKSLLVHNESHVSDFYINKKNGSDGYFVYLNNDYENVCSTINATDEFPITPDENYYGNNSFEPYDKSDNYNGVYLFTSSQRLLTSNEQVACKERVITKNNFCAVFEKPLSSHFVMLKKASLLYVYSKTAQIGKNDYLGYGGIFILLPDGLKIDEIKAYKSFFQLISDCISICVAYNIMRVKQIRETVRSAIAQVMARNMSHNYGSHVFSNLINDGVYERMVDSAIETIQKYHSSEQLDKELYKDKNTENHQLQYFFQYLKNRMDYLSEVTFGTSNILTTKMMYGDVMKELDQVRILLNYISGVSGFKYQFELIHNGNLLKDKDVAVAFPSDVLGCHAFYNIIENIIRNTAKHAGGKSQDESPIIFTINFKELEGCDGIEDADGLYCVEIDNGIEEDGMDDIIKGKKSDEDGGKVKGLIDRLNDSVLDNDNQNLRSHSLGLLEMEASAAFLRQIDLPEIESDDYFVAKNNNYYYEHNGKKRLNIIKPFKTVDGHLGYRFFVQKPKEFLFVGNWDVADAKKKELLNFGIQFISEDDFNKAMGVEKAFAHQFLIYDNTVSAEVKYKIEKDVECGTLLPLRKLLIDETDRLTISKLWDYSSSEERKKNLLDLKIWAWDWYFSHEMVEKESVSSPDILIRTSYDTNSRDKNQVVFLDHGNEEGLLKDCSQILNKEEAWIENLTNRTRSKLPDFTELSKGNKEPIHNYVASIRASKDDNCELSRKKRMIREEIFEAYHNKVIILDERVQLFAEKNNEGKEPLIPSWSLFRSTNVFIPFPCERPIKYKDKERKERYSIPNWADKDYFSLDPNDFDENKEKVKAFVEYYSKEYKPTSKPFILVHYGVLERMCDGDVKEINDLLKHWVGMAKRVVVTSGRGTHSLDLPKSVCFVNLSSVLYVCNENRNKYVINYLLNQSRRKKNE